MNKIFFFTLICSIALSFNLCAQVQSWHIMGPDDYSQPDYDYSTATAFTADKQGNLYAVYAAHEAGTGLTVITNNGTGWHVLGPRRFTQEIENAGTISIAAASIDNVYIAYADSGSLRAKVVHYDRVTNTWVRTGTTDFAIGYTVAISLALGPDLLPYFTYMDSAQNEKITVQKFDGSAWHTVGNAGFSAYPVGQPKIAVDGHGTPYVLYSEGQRADYLSAMKFDGNAWQYLGAESFSQGGAGVNYLALDSAGVPYVAFDDRGAGYNSYGTVMKFDGTTWSHVGTGPINTTTMGQPTLAFDSNNTPYIAYADFISRGYTSVRKFNGTTWQLAGAAHFGVSDAYNPVIVITPGNVPYVGYYSNNGYGLGDAKIKVERFDGSQWSLYQQTELSAGLPGAIKMAVPKNGAAVIAYPDSVYAGLATVKRYAGGGVWDTVGMQGFSSDAILDNAVFWPAVDESGNIYVAYMEQATDKSGVKGFDGSNWVALGNDFTNTKLITMAVDTGGTPYTAYMDMYTNKVFVKKYSAGAWSMVGSTASQNSVWWQRGQILMAFDNHGTPYVCYNDSAGRGKLTVIKYNGSNWQTVGSAAFTADTAYAPAFSIAPDGTPYVFYSDAGARGRGSCMKFNGSSWVYAGNRGFTPNAATESAFMVGRDGIPYVSFQDSAYNQRGSIMMFNGSNWVYKGQRAITAGEVYQQALGSDTAGNLIYVFNAQGVFAYRFSTTDNGDTITTSVCNGQSYPFNGGQIAATGSYTAHYTNSMGGDSLLVVNLTVSPPYHNTISAGICNGHAYNFNGAMYDTSGVYTALLTSIHGCDSVVTLNLSLLPTSFHSFSDTICRGQVVQGHTESGTYNDTLTGANGCDSIATLNLTVLVCSGINEPAFSYTLTLFPNPAKDYTTVQLSTNLIGCVLQLNDAAGRLVSTQKVTGIETQLQTAGLAPGVYFVKVITPGNGEAVRKLVVE